MPDNCSMISLGISSPTAIAMMLVPDWVVLPTCLPLMFDLYISSPLQRSYQTCKFCADLHKLPVATDERLLETNILQIFSAWHLHQMGLGMPLMKFLRILSMCWNIKMAFGVSCCWTPPRIWDFCSAESNRPGCKNLHLSILLRNNLLKWVRWTQLWFQVRWWSHSCWKPWWVICPSSQR